MKEFQHIFLCDDSPEDSCLLEQTVLALWPEVTIHTPRATSDLRDFIFRLDDYAELPEPDLCISDANMPYYSGFDVSRMLARAYPERSVPCIMVSGVQGELSRDYQAESYTNPVSLFLVKPITAQELTLAKEYLCPQT